MAIRIDGPAAWLFAFVALTTQIAPSQTQQPNKKEAKRATPPPAKKSSARAATSANKTVASKKQRAPKKIKSYTFPGPGPELTNKRKAELKRVIHQGLQAAVRKDAKAFVAWYKELVIPNYEAWFRSVIKDPEMAAHLAHQYSARAAVGLDPKRAAKSDLRKRMQVLVYSMRKKVFIRRHISRDEASTGFYTRRVLAHAKRPLPLYIVWMTRFDRTLPHEFNIFVYVGGKFRVFGYIPFPKGKK